MNQVDVTVLGGGSFGTVLANLAAENGHNVTLWLRDKETAEQINQRHENPHYMPGYHLDDKVVATTDLKSAVTGAAIIFIAIPSSGFRTVIQKISADLDPEQILISTTKGFEEDGFMLMSQILASHTHNKKIGVLSGPNLAKEIAQKVLTGTVVASDFPEVTTVVQTLLANSYFRVYSGSDMYGVELAGALKNIYAIISGFAAALGMGENTRSFLITRSLAEMSRFAVSLGANPLTFIGLAGVGDLIVTCMSPLSRNFRVGFSLGKGESLEQAITKLGEVAEGVKTLELVKHKADEMQVYMPLVNVLYNVIYEGLGIEEAIKTLMLSAQNTDVEFVVPGVKNDSSFCG